MHLPGENLLPSSSVKVFPFWLMVPGERHYNKPELDIRRGFIGSGLFRETAYSYSWLVLVLRTPFLAWALGFGVRSPLGIQEALAGFFIMGQSLLVRLPVGTFGQGAAGKQ